MTIIGISGKIGSGKDTVGKIIQYLTAKKEIGFNYPNSESDFNSYLKNKHYVISKWQIKKFADALKDIVCILTGCTREELENQEFKNSKLPDEWIRYGYANGFIKEYLGNATMGSPIMINEQCDKERYDIEYKTNQQTAYKSHMTYRDLLQVLGTDLFRKQFHNDTWVNALMSKYKECTIDYETGLTMYPNWIITDVRFPNEAKAIKDKKGINIRISRFDITGQGKVNNHVSETALDDYEFDYHIDNFGTIDDLIKEVDKVLTDYYNK